MCAYRTHFSRYFSNFFFCVIVVIMYSNNLCHIQRDYYHLYIRWFFLVYCDRVNFNRSVLSHKINYGTQKNTKKKIFRSKTKQMSNQPPGYPILSSTHCLYHALCIFVLSACWIATVWHQPLLLPDRWHSPGTFHRDRPSIPVSFRFLNRFFFLRLVD